jgi:hypothetical protein
MRANVSEPRLIGAQSVSRASDAQFVVGHNDKAWLAGCHVFVGKQGSDLSGQRQTSGILEAQEQQSGMRTRAELAHVGKIKVLRYQEPPFDLRSPPDHRICPPLQTLAPYRVNVMAEFAQLVGNVLRQVLVEPDVRPTRGAAGRGGSSLALPAAKAITARTASGVRVGKSATIPSTVAPSAKRARMVRSVTRVARMTGSPPHICGSRRMGAW